MTTRFLPKLQGNEIITIIFSLAYLSWREEDKEEMARIRREDKEELARIRSEDKVGMSLFRREGGQEMATVYQSMTTTSIITTSISLASAIGSMLYTYYSINSK